MAIESYTRSNVVNSFQFCQATFYVLLHFSCKGQANQAESQASRILALVAALLF